MPQLRLKTATGRWALLATVLGTSLAFLDATVANLALPHIGAEFDTSLAGLQWVVTGYTVSLAGLILLGGALGDRYGRRRIYLVGVVWFGLASLLCAVAPNIGALIAARILQGVGGALLTPGSLALIQASFHPDDRARAIGAWSGLSGVATAVGPFLGGWLIGGPGWRWIFLINVPLALVVIAVTVRHLPESRDEAATGRFDVTGAVLGAGALSALTYALTIGGTASTRVTAWVTGASGLVLFAVFLLVEWRRSHPMLPLSVFSSTQFSAVNAVTFVVYAALGGVFFFAALQLQIVVGFSALAAGAALLPITMLLLLLSSSAGALAQRIGPRWPMAGGTALATLGALLLARIDAQSSYVVDVLPAATIFGLGLALLVAPLTATVLASVPTHQAGIASGVNNAVARTGQLLAVAGLPLLAGLAGGDYQEPEVFSTGYRMAMFACAVLLAAGCLLSVLMVRDDALRQPTRPTVARAP
ncbi:MAG TPA: MFS transporter [Micromonosporaceae bacterium]|nr:MFS transporter [Micromonosporaceae bacterium]